MPKKKNKYQEFINSHYWKKIRKIVLNRDNKTCQICGSRKKLRVHHIAYEVNGVVGWKEKRQLEQIDYLITLCENCHTDVHKTKNHPLDKKIVTTNESNETHTGSGIGFYIDADIIANLISLILTLLFAFFIRKRK